MVAQPPIALQGMDAFSALGLGLLIAMFYDTLRFVAGRSKPLVFLCDLIGFAVADAEKEWQEKEKAGLCPGPMVTPNPHAKFFTVKDPNGVEIQFLQED